MSYGGGNRGNHAWSLSEEESKPFIIEAGINFFDTANRHSLGNSEEILGRAIRDFARCDEVVLTTKVYGRMRPGPNGAGRSRKAIFAEIDAPTRTMSSTLASSTSRSRPTITPAPSRTLRRMARRSSKRRVNNGRHVCWVAAPDGAQMELIEKV